MKIEITFTDGLLGTAPSNSELYENYIASKCADKDKIKEELEALETDELVEKSMTVFRKVDGVPVLFDYQIRGFIKEQLGIKCEFENFKIGKSKISKWTYKRFVDNYIFANPRTIKLIMPPNSEITTCTRPLRASTQKGDRIALAHSEEVPEGTTLQCEIEWDHPALEEIVRKCLDKGRKKGLGQWRNSGKGRFEWREIA